MLHTYIGRNKHLFTYISTFWERESEQGKLYHDNVTLNSKYMDKYIIDFTHTHTHTHAHTHTHTHIYIYIIIYIYILIYIYIYMHRERRRERA